jgi:hypothetical protein
MVRRDFFSRGPRDVRDGRWSDGRAVVVDGRTDARQGPVAVAHAGSGAATGCAAAVASASARAKLSVPLRRVTRGRKRRKVQR